MTNSTNRAICNKGNIARKMEFKTICRPTRRRERRWKYDPTSCIFIYMDEARELTDVWLVRRQHLDMHMEETLPDDNNHKTSAMDLYLLGTPLTSFNGRITRNARSDLTSKPCTSYLINITLRNLHRREPVPCLIIPSSKQARRLGLPDYNDDKIEEIPAASQIGIRM